MSGLLLQLLVTGLAMGAVYALMSMGLLLLIRAIGVLNFAQGDLFMFGAYIGWGLTNQAKLPLPGIVIALIPIFFIMAVIFMFGVYWPLRNSAWPTAIIICTIGASSILTESSRLIWGAQPMPLKPLIEGSLKIGTASIGYTFIITIAVGAILIAGVFFLFEKFYAGRIMQAAAQDKYAAEIMGIPTVITTLATYFIVMTIAGTAGYMIAPAFFVSPVLSSFQARAFAGVILGGWGSLKGSVIGSFIVGLIESFAAMYTTTYRETIVFMVLIIVLLVRPQGFFGSKVSDKA